MTVAGGRGGDSLLTGEGRSVLSVLYTLIELERLQSVAIKKKALSSSRAESDANSNIIFAVPLLLN